MSRRAFFRHFFVGVSLRELSSFSCMCCSQHLSIKLVKSHLFGKIYEVLCNTVGFFFLLMSHLPVVLQNDPNLADDEKAEKEFLTKRKYTVRCPGICFQYSVGPDLWRRDRKARAVIRRLRATATCHALYISKVQFVNITAAGDSKK